MARTEFFKDFRDWFLQPFKTESKSVWHVFALCFLTAFIFWVFNSLNKTYTTIIKFPLQVVYDDENYIPVNDLPTSTKMEVSGFGWDLLRWSLGFGLEPMTLIPEEYDQNSLNLSDYRNSINEKLGQVKLNKFINDTLYLDFDRKESKKFSLKLDSSSFTFKEGYRFQDSIIIVPDSILLTGPKSILDNMKDNFMVRLDENNIDSDFDEQVELDFKSTPLVRLGRNNVNVFFRVEKVVKKEMDLRVSAGSFPADSIVFNPQKVKLRYSISDEVSAQADSIRAIADFSNFNAADSSIGLLIRKLPEEFENARLVPDSVKVKMF